MSSDFRDEASGLLKEYMVYLLNVKSNSPSTVNEYYRDLKSFFRYIKRKRGLADPSLPDSKIPVCDVDIELVSSVTVTDFYDYMYYLSDQRSNSSGTRARKTTAIKGFFSFLAVKKHYLPDDPLKEIDRPHERKKRLPKYLTLEQSIELLNAVDGKYKERDYCILTFFLNCGMRLSELVSMNYTDIRPDNTVRIIGKGNKERIIYLNDACISAYKDYMKVRPVDGVPQEHKHALFLSSRNRRISREMVQKLVYKYLQKIGLDAQGYSVHKLRHTAATLMYQNGNVDIRVLKEILGHENLGTTEIYTHLNTTQMENAAKANPLSKVKRKTKQDE